MIVIVTGGRKYRNWQHVYNVLDKLDPTMVIQGGALGADDHAKTWSAMNEVPCVTEKAKWHEHGDKAGPIRNRVMCDKYPDALVVAFPGGSGTEDCVSYAISKGMIVIRAVEPKESI